MYIESLHFGYSQSLVRSLLLAAILAVASDYAAVGANSQGASVTPILQQSAEASCENTRYGFLGLLDHLSAYGQGVFPEPFLVDDSDLEVNEARLDWLHTEGLSQRSDLVTAELEKGFGLLTLEVEIPYERDNSAGVITEGVGNIDVGARYPLYQCVSRNEFVDVTFGAAVEAGIPVNSSVSKNTEVVPKVFNDLRLGDHFTLQSVLGYSRLFGGGAEGGLETLEYGFVFGWTIQHKQLRLPRIQQLIPMFELDCATALNKDVQTSVLGDVGFRANLKAIGFVQPRLGFAYVFPISEAARQNTHWGVVTSLVFEF